MNNVQGDPVVDNLPEPVKVQDKVDEYTKSPVKLFTQKFGAYKLKDQINRDTVIINNKKEFMVVKDIMVRKVPGANNKIEILLIMPNPEDVEVAIKKST